MVTVRVVAEDLIAGHLLPRSPKFPTKRCVLGWIADTQYHVNGSLEYEQAIHNAISFINEIGISYTKAWNANDYFLNLEGPLNNEEKKSAYIQHMAKFGINVIFVEEEEDGITTEVREQGSQEVPTAEILEEEESLCNV